MKTQKIVSNCPLCEEHSLHVVSSTNFNFDNQQCIYCGYVSSYNFKLNGKSKEDVQAYIDLTENMKQWVKIENDRIWIPTIMTLHTGMLYPFDNEDGEMKWAFAPMVDIPKDEQKNYPIPEQEDKFYAQKYDTDNKEEYDTFLECLHTLNERAKVAQKDENSKVD